MPSARRSKKRRAAVKKGYRSGFEQEIAEKADKEGIEYEYESKDSKIEYTPKVSKYLPDFILANGVIVEAKGRFTAKDRVKHLRIKEQHPDLDIRFVFQFDNKLSPKSKTRYSDWCRKHGFEFSFLNIPKKWAK